MKINTMFRILMSMLVIVICLSSVGIAAEVQKTLHVSPSGSNKNSGTEQKPFKTILRARDEVRKINQSMTGDIEVILHGGTYKLSETLVFDHRDGGHGGHQVVYKAAKGETPVISGGKVVTGWQPDTDGRWKAKTDIDNFRQLYIDGKRAVRARGDGLPGAVLQGNSSYKTTAVEMADWKNPSDIEFCYYVMWCHTRCKVESIKRDGDHAIVTMLQPHFTIARTKQGVQVKLPAYIENAFELLNDPGEWYLDRSASMVYYIPKANENMRTVRVIVPVVEKLVELRGTLERPVDNIHFEGITFAHASWLRPSRIGLVDVQANFLVDLNKKFNSIPHLVTTIHNENLKSPANIVCRVARSIRFERCTFTKLGGAGLDLEFGSRDNVISGCRFYDISGSAIQVGDVLKDDHHPDDKRKIVKNNAVLNNYIHNCCLDYKGGTGIFVGYTNGTVVSHNEICHLPYSAVSVGWGWGEEDAGGGTYHQPFRYDTPTPSSNNRVEFNHIHHVMNQMQDGGAIYTLSNMPNTVIRNNNIHNNTGSPGGIYLDEGSGFIEVMNNVVYNVPKAMLLNNGSQGRNKTCSIHKNYFKLDPKQTDDWPTEVHKIIKGAGLNPEYLGLMK